MRKNYLGALVEVNSGHGPPFIITNVYWEELEALAEQFGKTNIKVVAWGDFAEGRAKHKTQEHRKMIDLLAGV
jgi:hypothetical protein